MMMELKLQLMRIISSMDATRKKRRRLAGILFILYLIVLFYFLFFSEEMGRTYLERDYHYNLKPFKEIKRFIQYWRILGIGTVLLNIVGNIAAFVPFGTFIPVFAEKCKKFWWTALYGFELSLLVELVQLASKVGCFDVDDLLLNTIGAMIGYGVYAFAIRYVIYPKKKQHCSDTHAEGEKEQKRGK